MNQNAFWIWNKCPHPHLSLQKMEMFLRNPYFWQKVEFFEHLNDMITKIRSWQTNACLNIKYISLLSVFSTLSFWSETNVHDVTDFSISLMSNLGCLAKCSGWWRMFWWLQNFLRIENLLKIGWNMNDFVKFLRFPYRDSGAKRVYFCNIIACRLWQQK